MATVKLRFRIQSLITDRIGTEFVEAETEDKLCAIRLVLPKGDNTGVLVNGDWITVGIVGDMALRADEDAAKIIAAKEQAETRYREDFDAGVRYARIGSVLPPDAPQAAIDGFKSFVPPAPETPVATETLPPEGAVAPEAAAQPDAAPAAAAEAAPQPTEETAIPAAEPAKADAPAGV